MKLCSKLWIIITISLKRIWWHRVSSHSLCLSSLNICKWKISGVLQGWMLRRQFRGKKVFFRWFGVMDAGVAINQSDSHVVCFRCNLELWSDSWVLQFLSHRFSFVAINNVFGSEGQSKFCSHFKATLSANTESVPDCLASQGISNHWNNLVLYISLKRIWWHRYIL